jgi:hypothetical protein
VTRNGSVRLEFQPSTDDDIAGLAPFYRERHHVVQFYDSDEFLLDVIAPFIGDSLLAGYAQGPGYLRISANRDCADWMVTLHSGNIVADILRRRIGQHS